LGKGRVNDRPEQFLEDREYFHWYDGALFSNLEVDKEKLEELRGMFESSDLSVSEDERSRILGSFRRGRRGGHMKVDSLKRICKAMDMNPNDLEKMGLFKRKYPIPLDQPEVYKLMTHIINEGDAAKKRYPQVVYNNSDQSLHDRVAELVKTLGGRYSERPGHYNPRTLIDSTTSKTLVKAGLILGKKTRNQYLHPLPDSMKDAPTISRYHLSATFTEEGWPSIGLRKDQRPEFLVAYSRSVDITDRLPQEYKQSMQRGEKRTAGKMPKEVRYLIDFAPFPLFEDEVNTLIRTTDGPVRVDFVSIYKSKDGHVTAEWRVTLRHNQSIERFREEIGFLSGSEVNRRFEEMWKIYQEYKEKILTKEDIKEIKERLRSL